MYERNEIVSTNSLRAAGARNARHQLRTTATPKQLVSSSEQIRIDSVPGWRLHSIAAVRMTAIWNTSSMRTTAAPKYWEPQL